MARDDDRYIVRMPDGMRDRIRDEALSASKKRPGSSGRLTRPDAPLTIKTK